MLLKPTQFKISEQNNIANGHLQTLAKEGINFKTEDTEIEVVGSDSDSPIQRTVVGKKFEVKAIMIGNEWASTPANELLNFDYATNVRIDDFLTNNLDIDFIN